MASNPTSQEVEQHIGALPLTMRLESILDEKAVLQAHSLIKINDDSLSSSIDEQIAKVGTVFLEQADRTTEGGILTTDDEVRGVVARAAIAGAMQTAFALGGSFQELASLERWWDDNPDSATA